VIQIVAILVNKDVLSKDLERGIASDLTVDREGSQVSDMVCLEVFQSSLGKDFWEETLDCREKLIWAKKQGKVPPCQPDSGSGFQGSRVDFDMGLILGPCQMGLLVGAGDKNSATRTQQHPQDRNKSDPAQSFSRLADWTTCFRTNRG
jgi:hypothetical protein